jgi:hypothetical protein
MIKSGCDELSRASLIDPHCATLTPAGWSSVLDLAKKVNRELSTDWFADNINWTIISATRVDTRSQSSDISSRLCPSSIAS